MNIAVNNLFAVKTKLLKIKEEDLLWKKMTRFMLQGIGEWLVLQ